jgi:hypothetical protein
VIRPRGWPRSPPSAWSFRRFFAADLDAGAERSEPPAQPAGLPVFALATVACTLAGFVVTSATGVAPAWAAFAGAALLAARALRGRRTTPAALARAAAVPFLAFVVCLGIVVAAVVANGLGAALRPLVPAGTSLPALLAVAALAACSPPWSTTCPPSLCSSRWPRRHPTEISGPSCGCTNPMQPSWMDGYKLTPITKSRWHLGRCGEFQLTQNSLPSGSCMTA